MTKNYLLEIGLEEIPARFLRDLEEQLKERFITFLADNRLTYQEVQTFATPRRLAILVKGLAERQKDFVEEVKGPSLKIAQDAEGHWSKAAQGFVKGQGGQLEDLYIQELKGEAYVFYRKASQGKAVELVLAELANVLDAMTFPMSMTWNVYDKAFIRPLHWIVSLLDEQVIPFEFIGITANNRSQGHRFLGKEVTIRTPLTYAEQLAEEFVLAAFDERQARILQQIESIGNTNDWNIPIDSDLLDEVTAIVEWPTAFAGDFSEEYLEVPSIVLITAMRDHQRYFYAEDPTTGTLLAKFITVRNGNDQHLENVIKGNEKVIRARLEDALFFYKDDMSRSIDYFLAKLANVKEHYQLGSILDKQERVESLLKEIPTFLQSETDIEVAQAAAKIYKFDLMTAVVNEFDELQGQIGAIYAGKFGVADAIANAIGEQYLPDSSGGSLPETEAGALLALSDKLDTLLGYFSIDLIPTGSNDPYALRRQAMGLVEIIYANRWDFNLLDLIQVEVNKRELKPDLTDKLVNFIQARLQQFLERKAIDHDIIQAVMHSRSLNIFRLSRFAELLQNYKETEAEGYRGLVEALSRTVNLGIKVEEGLEITADLSQTDSERVLIQLIQNDLVIDSKDALAAYRQLVVPLTNYFDNNMVNTDDLAIRNNRYASLKVITDFILLHFDPRELISKF